MGAKYLTVLGTGAALFSFTTYAASLEELKNLLNQKDVEINLAVTGNYLYTADRSDKITGNNGKTASGYEDAFGYNAYLGLFKEATAKSPFGFGLELSNNDWAPVVGIEPLPDIDNYKKVTIDQAYVEAKLSFISIKAGRILTNIGGEAPYTWQNINIQRGLVWNGEPVFYNGVRVSAQLGMFNVYVGANDRDTSDGKMAFEGGIGADLPFKTSASFNILIPDSKDDNPTKVYNLTFTNNLFERAPITFYVDYLDTPQKGQDSQSVGAALLVDLKFTTQISVGTRVEYVNNDSDGDNYGIGSGNHAWTFTVTPKYQFNKYLYVRGEASYVTLGKKIYQKKNNPNSLTDSEVRIGAEIGFVF